MPLRHCPHPTPGDMSCTGAYASWEGFCAHVYERHTDPDLSEVERAAQADAFMKRPRPVRDANVYRPRPCPVDASCGEITGWSTLLEHLYAEHTEGDENDRQETVRRLLAQGGYRLDPRPGAVVPKVTANPLTEALWRLSQDDRTAARRVLIPLGESERRAYLAQLTQLINMLWEEL